MWRDGVIYLFFQMKRKFLPIILPLLATGPMEAAVLSGTVNTSPGSTVNLSTDGGLNWALWSVTSDTLTSTTTNSRASTNHKSGGPAEGGAGYISGISAVGGTSQVRGSTSLPAITYTYSDGSSPASLSPAAKQGTIFNSKFDDTTGVGLSLTVTGDPSQLYRVNVWATGYSGVGQITATLNNATEVQLLSQTFDNTKQPVLFTFEFQPDSAADLLHLSYILHTDGGLNSSHIEIQAVTVTVIPEPSSLAVAGLFGGLALVRRRRR